MPIDSTSISSPFHTTFRDQQAIRRPIPHGAMRGGGGNVLVAAVSVAGGLGVIPTFGGTEAGLRTDIEAGRRPTTKPFGVNITPMGRGFTEFRAAIAIEMGVPIVTTGRADPGAAAVHG